MNIMTLIAIVASVLSVVLNLVILSKMGKILYQVKLPSVRKKSGDFKLKPVRKPGSQRDKSEGQGGRGKNGRARSEGSRGRGRDDRGGRGRAMKPATSSEVFSNDADVKKVADSSEKTPDSSATNEQTRDNRGARNSRGGRGARDRGDRGSRSDRGGQSGGRSRDEAPRSPVPERQETPKEADAGRPALAPRGEAPGAPSESAPAVSPPVAEGSASKSEDKVIRHGRRNAPRRTPQMDDESAS